MKTIIIHLPSKKIRSVTAINAMKRSAVKMRDRRMRREKDNRNINRQFE